MATLTCGFEGGTLNGAIDSSGGDATVAITASSAWVYSNTHVNRGTLAAKLPGSATGTQRIAWVVTPVTKALLRTYYWVTNHPSADTYILHAPPLTDNSAGQGARLIINSLGAARLTDNGAAVVATNTGVQVPNGQWVRFELWLDAGTTATNGSLRGAYYIGNSTTPTWDSGLITGKNVAGTTGSLASLRFGMISSTGGDQWFDDIAAKTNTDAVWGAWPAANLPPIVVAGPNQTVAVSTLVTMAPTVSDSDGTISTQAWTMTYASDGQTTANITGASTLGATFTTGSTPGSLYILTLTVTDNDGGITTDTVEVRVPTTGNARPLPGNGTGDTWTIIGGSATQGEALSDASSTTRVESPDMTSTASVHQWRIAPMATRSALNISELATVLTASVTDASVGRLYCGTTLIKSWSMAATTSDQTVSVNLTSPEVASILDWGELYVQARAATT